MIGMRKGTAALLSQLAAALLLATMLAGLSVTAWAATPQPPVTWTTKADFENNAVTNSLPTTRSNIDTTTMPDAVTMDNGSREFVSPATITCLASGKVYTTGPEQTSVIILDPATSKVIGTIDLGGKAAGAVLSPDASRLYIGRQDTNQIVVIDTTNDSVHTVTLANGTAGRAAYVAAYNPDQNKLYVANTGDATVTILHAGSETELATVKVAAGATTASFFAGRVYLTSKTNQYVTVIDGVTDQVLENVQVRPVVHQIGGQGPDSVGLLISDAAAMGITGADRIKLSWTYECTAKDEFIRFRVRTALDRAALIGTPFEGPGRAEDSWYETHCSDATSSPQTGFAYLETPFNNAAEILVKLDSDGLSSPVLHDVTLEFEQYPDLTVSDLTATPAVLSAGDQFTVSATVVNSGLSAADPSILRLSLLAPDGAAITLHDAEVPALQPGGPFQINVPLTMPAVTHGPYSILACADAALTVPETDDSNNCRQIPVTVAIPDLEITAVGGPATGTIGSTIAVASTVKNNGGVAAGSFLVGLYLTRSGVDYPLEPARSVTSLAAGTSSPGSTTVTIPTTLPTGDYNLKACADSGQTVKEYEEGNNCFTSAETIAIRSSQADLVVIGASGSVTNGKLYYSVTVKNNGKTPAVLNYTGIYLSADAVIDTSDHLVTSEYYGGTIGEGLTKTFTYNSDVPTDLIGTFYVGGYADYTQKTPEWDENNNGLAGNQVTIINDLIVVADSVTGSVASGKLTYSLTVKNNGNGQATLNYTGVYLSLDSSIDTSDIMATTVYYGGALAGGSTKLQSGVVDVPTDVTGNFYLGGYADYTNRTPETDNANNGTAGPQLSIINDLIIVADSVTGTVANGKLTYSVTVKNIGNGQATLNYTGIYLSADSSIDTSDLMATNVYYGGALAGGSTKLQSGVVDVPRDVTGNFYLGGYADYTDRTPETDNANNGTAGTLLSIINDLVILADSVTGSVANGKLTYSVTVKNNGNGQATLNYTGVYLSADSSIDTSDILATNVYYGGTLAGGSTKLQNGVVDVPTDVTGNFYLGGYADYTNKTPEADNANNGTAGTLLSIINDLVIVADSVTGSVANGKLTYSVTVKNNGNGQATLNYTGVYLSADSSIDTSDILATNVYYGGALAGGSTKLQNGVVDVPTDIAGNLYLGGYADYTNRTPETDNANNGTAGTLLSIVNDLVIVADSVTGSVANGKLTYSVTVKNNGNGQATLNYTGIYLSADSSIETSDIMATTVYYGGALAGGSTKLQSGVVDVPTDVTGNLYLGGYADYTNRTPETDNANNGTAGSQLSITNDLVVVPGSVTGSVVNGTITYALTVKNNGNGQATLNYTGIYLSPDLTIDTNDILAGSVYYGGPLAGGSTRAQSGTATVPAGVTGSQYLGGYADYTRRTPESNESNNGTAGTRLTL